MKGCVSGAFVKSEKERVYQRTEFLLDFTSRIRESDFPPTGQCLQPNNPLRVAQSRSSLPANQMAANECLQPYNALHGAK